MGKVGEQSDENRQVVALVAVDLVERLPDVHPATLQLHMHQRQPVDKDRHVATRRMSPAVADSGFVLVEDLQPVVVDVLLVDQANVLRRPVVAVQELDVVLLGSATTALSALIAIASKCDAVGIMM